MKILAISHLFPHKHEERLGIFVARQLSAMANLGAELRVIVPTVWCPKILKHVDRWKHYTVNSPLCSYPGLTSQRTFYVRPPGNWFNRWSGLSSYLGMRKIVKDLHHRIKFDIIYATDLFPDGDTAARLANILGIPSACLAIGIDVHQTAFSSKTIYKHFVHIINRLDGTLACGKSVAETMDKITGQKSLSVYGVVDFDKFYPVENKDNLRDKLGLSKNCIYLLYAGYLDRRKGLYELLDAFAQAGFGKKIKLILCGDGSQKESLKKYAVEKNINNSVIMPGMIDPEEMNRWMQASDVFVLPSYSEGMPNVVMEAMACGIPVVATAVGGLPEAVGNCRAAILVPPKNIAALKEALVKVLNDHELRVKMKSDAIKRAKERFGVERNARLITDYLAKVIEESRIKRDQ